MKRWCAMVVIHTSTPEQTFDDLLSAGHAALARGAWAEARTCFVAALQQGETPEALEGLGMAAWGLNDAAVMFDTRERAYRLYRRRDDSRGAARVAANLAMDYFYVRGEYAIAGAWVQRGRRLLAAREACPEAGWLAVAEALMVAWVEHDFAAVQRLCAQAAALGQALEDINLEMLALACEGLALVSQGQISDGMRRLDEATLAAVAGEMTDVDAACTTCCCLIFACEWTRDYERAVQWITRLQELAIRRAHPTQFFFCRTHYAGLLVCQGAWAEAEAVFEVAITGLEASQPALAAEALVRLADLRCRQGRFEAAAELLAQAEQPPFRALARDVCLLGRAALALAQDDVESAIDLAEQFLRAIPANDRLERVGGLELLLVALVAHGDHRRAEAVLDELRAVASRVATKPMQATTRFAEGMLAAAAANYEMAKCCFGDAVDLWFRSGAPYETALARLELAQSLLALGRTHAAEQQAREALDVLEQLGAAPDAARAAALLRAIAHPPQAHYGTTLVDSDLTPRELEVLRLIAAGKSNQEIAHELVLSVRTVERHISNIYAKLGVAGTTARATATAYALQHSLISPPAT
jgi:LuxR family transcriptional regulator, maltose regulon positive regulatory protein